MPSTSPLAVAGAGILSLAGGYLIGTGIDMAIEQMLGQPLGEWIYDIMHKDQDNPCPN